MRELSERCSLFICEGVYLDYLGDSEKILMTQGDWSNEMSKDAQNGFAIKRI